MTNIVKTITEGENQIVEFKSSFQKDVVESIAAFTNVKDDITGIELTPERLQNRINQVKQNFNRVMSMEDISNEYLKTKIAHETTVLVRDKVLTTSVLRKWTSLIVINKFLSIYNYYQILKKGKGIEFDIIADR